MPEVEATVRALKDGGAPAPAWSAAASAARCSRYCAPGAVAPARAIAVAPGPPARRL